MSAWLGGNCDSLDKTHGLTAGSDDRRKVEVFVSHLINGALNFHWLIQAYKLFELAIQWAERLKLLIGFVILHGYIVLHIVFISCRNQGRIARISRQNQITSG